MWLLEKLNYICGSQALSVGQHWVEDVETKNGAGNGKQSIAGPGEDMLSPSVLTALQAASPAKDRLSRQPVHSHP